jgi:hypothetical protein
MSAMEKSTELGLRNFSSDFPVPDLDDAIVAGDEEYFWPDPQPLTAKIKPEAYPLDALPGTIQEAVEEVSAFIKAPLPLVAGSALGALLLAIQAHCDIKRAERLTGPTGLFMLSIADSGERKTTCDGFFTSAIRQYEAEQAEQAAPLLKDYAAGLAAWNAEREGLLSAIRDSAKKGKDTQPQRDTLTMIEHDKPEPPRVPRLILGDETPENLAYTLAKSWLSAGVVATPATHDREKAATVANVASVAVANPTESKNPGLLVTVWTPESRPDDAFFADDRRHCRKCRHLRNGYCTRQRFRPVDDIPRRCEDFNGYPDRIEPSGTR